MCPRHIARAAELNGTHIGCVARLVGTYSAELGWQTTDAPIVMVQHLKTGQVKVHRSPDEFGDHTLEADDLIELLPAAAEDEPPLRLTVLPVKAAGESCDADRVVCALERFALKGAARTVWARTPAVTAQANGYQQFADMVKVALIDAVDDGDAVRRVNKIATQHLVLPATGSAIAANAARGRQRAAEVVAGILAARTAKEGSRNACAC